MTLEASADNKLRPLSLCVWLLRHSPLVNLDPILKQLMNERPFRIAHAHSHAHTQPHIHKNIESAREKMLTWWSGQCGAFFNNNENSWQGFCGLLFWQRASTERAHWKNLAQPVGPRFNNKPLINEARVWIRGTDKKNTNRCEAVNLERLLYVFVCQLLFKYTTGQIDCASTYNATHGHFSTLRKVSKRICKFQAAE